MTRPATPVTAPQTQDEAQRWRQYEARKRVIEGWAASSQERDEAVRALVEELGL